MAPLFDIQLPAFDGSHWWLRNENIFQDVYFSPGILLLNQEQELKTKAVFKLMTLFLEHKGTKQAYKLESIF
jgi:hypothetical protein